MSDNPIVEALQLFTRNSMESDEALFQLCNAIIARTNEMQEQILKLQEQLLLLAESFNQYKFNQQYGGEVQ